MADERNGSALLVKQSEAKKMDIKEVGRECVNWIFFFVLFLLAVIQNTICKLMRCLYKVQYDTMYYYDVVGYSPSDVTSVAL
jgi:hypothetical protein